MNRTTLAGAMVVVLALMGARPLSAEEHREVQANNNTHAAGQIDNGIVTVRLRAARGDWKPDGEDGSALTIDAFGEEGRPLSVPAPLVRVTEGTTIVVSIRNELDAPLRVHGLCTRNGTACAPIDVAPAAARDVRFLAGQAGTYHYWATALGAPVPFRELAGALVIDPAGQTVPPDRIFVITEWSDLTAAQLRTIVTADDVGEAFWAARPRFMFVMNGRSWPATERLNYHRGDTVRWRVINLSSQTHPMHLHGFYFRVLRTGNGERDDAVGRGAGREVVTEVLRSGGTVLMEWTPEREGNWLFHCHIMRHVAPMRRLPADASHASVQVHEMSAGHHDMNDPSLGMAGMVLGITVWPAAGGAPMPAPATAVRRLTMVLGADHAAGVTMGVALREGGQSSEAVRLSAPGPPLVLRRGEPVEIVVENRLDESTSIHWHGMEVESLYDGVHGWSGVSGRTAPLIAPGASFVVRLTPSRAGTFIYHTHLHDYRQLSAGLYGALVVTEPAEIHDPGIDHVLVLGRRDASEASSVLEDSESVVVNGERSPRFVWRAGQKHRLRLINITPDDLLRVALVRGDEVATWRPVAKDGAPLSSDLTADGPARVLLAVGETMDVELDASMRPGVLWLDIRTSRGKWQAQCQVVLK
jgi:FtsP/CotA-like multicopper oxidase with cupredoxin domain